MKYRDLYERKKINETLKSHKELLEMIREYVKNFYKNDINTVRKMRRDINKKIKFLGLDSHEVYYFYGDIDDVKEKKNVLKKIGV